MKRSLFFSVVLVFGATLVQAQSTDVENKSVREPAETRNTKEFSVVPEKSVKDQRRTRGVQPLNGTTDVAVPTKEIIEQRRREMNAKQTSTETASPKE